MAYIEIEFYEKTYSHCTQCENMKAALMEWIEQNKGKDQITLFSLSAEDNIDHIQKEAPDAQSAPVVKVIRGTVEQWVSGNNPDILIDVLEGRTSIWDDIDE